MSDVSLVASHLVTGQSIRRQRLAQRRRQAGGPAVDRERRLRPGFVGVERELQRGEHEVPGRHAVPLLWSRDPHERPGSPLHPGAERGRPLERHAHAHGAALRERPEPTVAGAARPELPLGREALPPHGVSPPGGEGYEPEVGSQAAHEPQVPGGSDRKSTRLNSSHLVISYAVFCLKKKKKNIKNYQTCA